MKHKHAFIGVLRDVERGYAYWVAICKCGYRTQAEHGSRKYALGALMEHLAAARGADENPEVVLFGEPLSGAEIVKKLEQYARANGPLPLKVRS